MEKTPSSRTAEPAPDDRESYRRFRELAFSMVPEDKSVIASERSWVARTWNQMFSSTTENPGIVADYISLVAYLRDPQNLKYAPAALAGISF